MPEYEVTFTAKIKIRATNAAAAKYAIGREIAGRKLLRLGGSHSGIGPAPSKKGSAWRWNVKVTDEKMSAIKPLPRS